MNNKIVISGVLFLSLGVCASSSFANAQGSIQAENITSCVTIPSLHKSFIDKSFATKITVYNPVNQVAKYGISPSQSGALPWVMNKNNWQTIISGPSGVALTTFELPPKPLQHKVYISTVLGGSGQFYGYAIDLSNLCA